MKNLLKKSLEPLGQLKANLAQYSIGEGDSFVQM